LGAGGVRRSIVSIGISRRTIACAPAGAVTVP
jgi:hypothetical protein